MKAFRAQHDQTLLEQAAVERDSGQFGDWIIDLGRWLYSTDHIKVHYSIEYEGVQIVGLLPPRRG